MNINTMIAVVLLLFAFWYYGFQILHVLLNRLSRQFL